MTKLKTILGAGVLAAAGVAGHRRQAASQRRSRRHASAPSSRRLGAEKGGNAAGTIPAWNGGINVGRAGGRRRTSSRAVITRTRTRATSRCTRSTPRTWSKYAGEPHRGPQEAAAAYKATTSDERLSLAPQRGVPAAHLRRDQGHCDHRQADERRQRRHRRGRGHSVPDPASRASRSSGTTSCAIARDVAERNIGQAAVTAAAHYNLVKFHDETMVAYSLAGRDGGGARQRHRATSSRRPTAPARLAGEILLVHETLDQSQGESPRLALQPGPAPRAPRAERRLRQSRHRLRRPSHLRPVRPVQRQPERYDWKLVGKKEIVVPYNAYKLHSNKLKYDDILKPHHINQDLARYELHRVWVVDSTLKAGQRHLYSRRTFYVDEDCWQILAVDCYDEPRPALARPGRPRRSSTTTCRPSGPRSS